MLEDSRPSDPNPAESLRRAAALMRERAQSATEGDATHVASWNPVVTLAVADWLDATAAENESPEDSALSILNFCTAPEHAALAVASAYLGGSHE